MDVQTINGMVPRVADVLMLGVAPDRFDNFQRSVKGSLQGAHIGWDYVANLGKDFDHAIREVVPKRPQLDMVYITNEVDLSPDDLRSGATKLSYELARNPAKPWVILDPSLSWLEHIFHSRCITVSYSIEGGMQERYEQKCRIAEASAA